VLETRTASTAQFAVNASEKKQRRKTYIQLKSVAPNLTGGVVPSCGHFLPEESPEALLEHLVPFLRDAQ